MTDHPPASVAPYFDELDEERRAVLLRLRAVIAEVIPDGFEEMLNDGFPSWVVPHSLYPPGYHVDPELPLPFLAIAAQQRHIGVYHMGIHSAPELLAWFEGEYPKHMSTKLNMGKSCIRFSYAKPLPYDLIAELCSKMTAQDWIEGYERAVQGWTKKKS
jgi:hypothetical protein